MFLVRPEHANRVRRTHLDGPADLVVEVISPGTEDTDRGAKFYEYERGGVPEYWLIDPDRETADFYLRDEKGVYRIQPTPEGVFRSRQLDGFELRVEWLWTRPSVLRVLRDLGVV
ncbi:MAG: Uma2 family endonuclease [Hyphomicrobiales bacterium]